MNDAGSNPNIGSNSFVGGQSIAGLIFPGFIYLIIAVGMAFRDGNSFSPKYLFPHLVIVISIELIIFSFFYFRFEISDRIVSKLYPYSIFRREVLISIKSITNVLVGYVEDGSGLGPSNIISIHFLAENNVKAKVALPFHNISGKDLVEALSILHRSGVSILYFNNNRYRKIKSLVEGAL